MKPFKKITWPILLTISLFSIAKALAADAPATDSSTESFRDEPSHVHASAIEPTLVIPKTNANNLRIAAASDKGLRLNFRGVPLEMVLKYMSDAAGFIIVPETDVKGKVDVWSDEPLNKEEAVGVLNSSLNKSGFAAIQNGRTLTIVNRQEARKMNIPVRKGNDPEKIPSDAEIITQVIPVHSLNVVQLPKDLAPLLATDATLTANESGNSLLMTDTQANIRRITEIIKALDSVSASINSIRVFPVKYADAKSLADIVKELFPSPDSNRTGGNNGNGGNPGRFRGNGGNRNGGGGNFANIAAMFNGGGFGGEDPAGGNGGDNGNESNGRTPVSRVSAVADDHGNSLVVSAPDTLMPTIEQLITSLDNSSQDITEMRVFHLQNSDPTEMVDLLSGLFPDENNSNDAIRSASQFAFSGYRGGPFGGGFGRLPFLGNNNNNNNNSNSQSDRMKRMGRVIAMADARTSSLVVSAARDLMPQIESMINQLDASPAKKQKVHVVSLSHADPQDVQLILEDLFQSPYNMKNNSANSLQNNPLTSRSQTLLQQQQQQQSSGNGFGLTSGGNNSGRGF